MVVRLIRTTHGDLELPYLDGTFTILSMFPVKRRVY